MSALECVQNTAVVADHTTAASGILLMRNAAGSRAFSEGFGWANFELPVSLIPDFVSGSRRRAGESIDMSMQSRPLLKNHCNQALVGSSVSFLSLAEDNENVPTPYVCDHTAKGSVIMKLLNKLATCVLVVLLIGIARSTTKLQTLPDKHWPSRNT